MTLAESQAKKASFLREVVRTVGVAAEVFAGRIETMDPATRFDIVTLRAVDDPERTLRLARTRLKPIGLMARWTVAGDTFGEPVPLPGSRDRVIDLGREDCVPRGT